MDKNALGVVFAFWIFISIMFGFVGLGMFLYFNYPCLFAGYLILWISVVLYFIISFLNAGAKEDNGGM